MSSTPLSTMGKSNDRKHITLRRLPAVGLLALVIALITNIMIGSISYALFSIPATFVPLNLIPITSWTVLGVLGATVVFGMLVRLNGHPIVNFSKIALIVLPISFLPVLILLFSSPFPDTTPIGIIALLLMHVATATICLVMFTSLCSESDPEATQRE